MNILLAVAILALVSFTGSIVYVARAVVSYRNEPGPSAPHPEPTERVYREVTEMKGEIERMKFAVSEGIARVDRSEKRIQKTVTSARRQLREAGLEHAGIEAEHAELQSSNANGSEPLPIVPKQVGPTRTLRVPGGLIEW